MKEEERRTLLPHRRDATNTRRQLLEAARRRFARDGYTATTVREIADDVEVDAALISRYFGSKEDLFKACLEETAHEFSAATTEVRGLSHVVGAIGRAAGFEAEGVPYQTLLLLLRSSGDEGADQKRAEVLRNFATKIAYAAGWTPDQCDDEIILRAQLVISLAVGIAMLRSSAQLEPLLSATEEQLRAPLLDLITAALKPPNGTAGQPERDTEGASPG